MPRKAKTSDRNRPWWCGICTKWGIPVLEARLDSKGNDCLRVKCCGNKHVLTWIKLRDFQIVDIEG